MRARILFLAVAASLMFATPAAAHKLKVFAAVREGAIAGYAFFIGGGRAVGTPWFAKDAGGAEIASGETGADGDFRFVPPQPVASDITVTVDTREGHIASATIAASRLLPPGATAPPVSAAVAEEGPESGEGGSAATGADVAALVEAAVQRQVEPLRERIEEMGDRLRFTDVMSGIFLIVGLAGIGLWVRGRKP